MFEIETKRTVRLMNANFRSERHGEELVPAVDLKLQLEASNDVLSCFHGALKSALYFDATPDGAAGAQPELDGVEPVSNLRNLRFTKLAPLKWDAEQSGMRLEIDYGLGGDSDLQLVDGTANNFVIEPKEGGTVAVTFRLQFGKVTDEHVLGKLATLQGSDIDIILLGPEPQTAEEMFRDSEARTEKDATDLFLETQGEER